MQEGEEKRTAADNAFIDDSEVQAVMDDLVHDRQLDAMTAMVQNGEGGLMRTIVQGELDTQVALLLSSDEEEEDAEATLQGYTPGKCTNIIFVDEHGLETVCGEPTNPAEQLCHYCRVFGHRMTGLL